MFTARLPEEGNLERLGTILSNGYHIVVPVGRWNGFNIMRVSFQAYNSQADADRLVEAVQEWLREPK